MTAPTNNKGFILHSGTLLQKYHQEERWRVVVGANPYDFYTYLRSGRCLNAPKCIRRKGSGRPMTAPTINRVLSSVQWQNSHIIHPAFRNPPPPKFIGRKGNGLRWAPTPTIFIHIYVVGDASTHRNASGGKVAGYGGRQPLRFYIKRLFTLYIPIISIARFSVGAVIGRPNRLLLEEKLSPQVTDEV